jgi:hypothetical protein
MKVFGRKETIGDFALERLEDFQKRLDLDENPDILIDEVSKELGDSMERVLFINQALDKQEGK